MTSFEERQDDFEWIKVVTAMEWLRGGLGLWVARSGAYTITHKAKGKYRLCDGWGTEIGTAPSLKKAKAMADEREAR